MTSTGARIETAGAIVVRSPAAGTVEFVPPPAGAGELEVYRDGQPVARISSPGGPVDIAVPAGGFVLRRLVAPGAQVAPGQPLLLFRPA